jgi:stage IV sporulation protein FB
VKTRIKPTQNQATSGRHSRPFSTIKRQKSLDKNENTTPLVAPVNTSKTQAKTRRRLRLRLHPLFLALGVFYALKGELFLFFMSTLVALQHECAHAFAAAKLGYKLNAIVLMPFGAVIDGDLRSVSLKDEIIIALCGPICNLVTAAFFVALWWLAPTMYAFTDTACYSSLTIALVNLLPAYPLDGGRVLRCLLSQIFQKHALSEAKAEARATAICRIVTLLFSFVFFALFILQCCLKQPNLSALIFGLFLLAGTFGTANKNAVYARMDFSAKNALIKGAEIRRIAVIDTCPIKDVLRFVAKGNFLVLEVYDKDENHLFDLSQNQLSDLFLRAKTPYDPLSSFFTSP